jgi:hypothetical protein
MSRQDAEQIKRGRARTALTPAQTTESLQVADLSCRRTRGVLCRAPTGSSRRRQWSRGVRNPLFLPGRRPGPCSGVAHAPLVTAVVGAKIAWTKSVAARVECRLGTQIRSSLDREFDSQPDDDTEVVPLSAVHIRGEQEGEHGGGTGPRARCSPLSSTWPNTSHGRWQCVSSSGAPRQLQSALWVAEPGHRAAVCAARQVRRSWRNGQSQCRGVSDHTIWPLRLPSPRPRTWSLPPRCLCLSRSRSSLDACVRSALKPCGSAS